MGGLPLALWLAGAYLASVHTFCDLPGLAAPTTFGDYLHAWEKRFVELSDLSWDTEPARERELLCRTWELSLDLLDRRGHSHGRPLLRTFACLGRSPIPTVLLDPAVLATSSLFTGMTAAALNRTLIALGDVGLVEPSRAGSFATIGLHPVVRDVNRHQAQEDAAFRRTALTVLTHATEYIKMTDVATWPLWHNLVTHCAVAVELASDVGESDEVRRASADVCHKTAFFCDRAGLDLRAIDLNRTALNCRVEVLGPCDAKTLAAKHNLAKVLRKVGRFAEAASALREVLAAETAARGQAHEETLVTRCVLADVLRDQGELTTAEAELRDIARIVNETPHSYNRAVLAVNLLLARTLRERGNLSESENLLRNELVQARHEFGDNHEYTNAVLVTLAAVVRDQGKLVEADQLARTAGSAMSVLFGPEHEQTLATRTHNAAALMDRGDVAGAVAELRDILAAMEMAKGKEHPGALNVRRSLAVAIEANGDIVSAEAEYRQLLEAEQRVYRGSPTLETQYQLASILSLSA